MSLSLCLTSGEQLPRMINCWGGGGGGRLFRIVHIFENTVFSQNVIVGLFDAVINQGWLDFKAPSTVINLHAASTLNQHCSICDPPRENQA